MIESFPVAKSNLAFPFSSNFASFPLLHSSIHTTSHFDSVLASQLPIDDFVEMQEFAKRRSFERNLAPKPVQRSAAVVPVDRKLVRTSLALERNGREVEHVDVG